MSGSYLQIARHLLFLLIFWIGGTGMAAAQGGKTESYRLGPSEEISLRVVAWDNIALAFVDIEAISGVYTIDADGTVMLPIVGSVIAEGRTSTELAGLVAEALQKNTGLAEAPSVAIGIEQYRPLFVLGDVARPGEYPYRPGIRAVQALVLAGGFYRLAEQQGSSLVREGLRLSGSLRENRIQLTAARIREVRFEAEAAGDTDFSLPDGLLHPDGTAAIDQIYEREKALMEARREALTRSVQSLESSRELLKTEASTLRDKGEGLNRQVALMEEAVGNVETLVDKGLARSPNLLNMQRALFDLESRQLDAQNQVYRAQQELGEIERDLNEVTQRRVTDILNELQELQAQIAQLNVRDDTQQRMLVESQAEAALRAAEDDAAVQLVPVFRISRETDGRFETMVVSSDAVLKPLDVLEVRWTDPSALVTE